MANFEDIRDILNNPTDHNLPEWTNGSNEITGENLKGYLSILLSGMESADDFFNVNAYNSESQYGSSALARAAVPTNVKKLGLVIAYKLSDGWYIDQFIGDDTTKWLIDKNWRNLYSKLSDAELYLIRITSSTSTPDVELGSLSSVNGSEISSTTRARTDYIWVDGQFLINSTLPYNVFFYQSNSLPLDYALGQDWRNKPYAGNYRGYIRIVTNIEESDITDVNIKINSSAIPKDYSTLLFKKMIVELGSLSSVDGSEISRTDRIRTHYIKTNGIFIVRSNVPYNVFFFAKNGLPLDHTLSNDWRTDDYEGNYDGYIRIVANIDGYSIDDVNVNIALSGAYNDIIVDSLYYDSVKINNNIIGLDWDASQLEDSDTLTDSPYGIMFPKTYTPTGEPTKIVVMFHGHGGFVTSECLGYTNVSWTAWRNIYLSNGYAVMDINGFGVYNNDGYSNRPWGNWGAIQTVKKAFEKIKSRYNVADKLYLHGYSMGGQNAISYAMNFPNDVAAIAAFEPAFPNIPYSRTDLINTIVNAYGYSNQSSMIADNYSRLVGYSLPLAVQVYRNGQIINNGAVTYDFTQITTDYLVAKLGCPIRIWQGTVGDVINPNINKNVINALRNGGCTASLRLVTGADHDFFGSSSQEWIRKESLWFLNRY